MMKQRVSDIDFRTEVRQKFSKQDQTTRDALEAHSKEKVKNQTLTQ